MGRHVRLGRRRPHGRAHGDRGHARTLRRQASSTASSTPPAVPSCPQLTGTPEARAGLATRGLMRATRCSCRLSGDGVRVTTHASPSPSRDGDEANLVHTLKDLSVCKDKGSELRTVRALWRNCNGQSGAVQWAPSWVACTGPRSGSLFCIWCLVPRPLRTRGCGVARLQVGRGRGGGAPNIVRARTREGEGGAGGMSSRSRYRT